jgi:uncharacterized membrane protein
MTLPTTNHPPRLAAIDALRGAAMVWMAAFHGSFDLQTLGMFRPPQNFYADPFWTLQRVAIVSLFLFCAGIGQAAAQAAEQPLSRFWRRWAQVVGCALAVSAGSALMFPRSWISFGVLHGIALMLLVCRFVATTPARALAIAAVALALPQVFADPLFDSRWTNWVGLVTRKPVTEDYVPLMPWLGVMLIGWVVGRAWVAAPGRLAAPLPKLLQPLAVLGRWPLSFYMLHQPVLIGALTAWQALTR